MDEALAALGDLVALNERLIVEGKATEDAT
jgi:hypothetical protein